MLRYDTLTPMVYIQYVSSFDRSAAAVLGLPLIFLTVAFLGIERVTRGHASPQGLPHLYLRSTPGKQSI